MKLIECHIESKNRIGAQTMKQKFGYCIVSFYAVITLSAFLVLTFPDPVRAGEGDVVSTPSEIYAGIFATRNRISNRIVDVDGFANWGQSGWAIDYDNSGSAGGVLIGRRYEQGDVSIRTELDIMSGGISATSNNIANVGTTGFKRRREG